MINAVCFFLVFQLDLRVSEDYDRLTKEKFRNCCNLYLNTNKKPW